MDEPLKRKVQPAAFSAGVSLEIDRTAPAAVAGWVEAAADWWFVLTVVKRSVVAMVAKVKAACLLFRQIGSEVSLKVAVFSSSFFPFF